MPSSGAESELLDAARQGDVRAFDDLVGPYRRELLVHCYRLVGSLQDAEEALQDALLAAWRGLPQFQARSSLRTWLYRIATTRSLNVRRSINRRNPVRTPLLLGPPPEPTSHREVPWLQPIPDHLLDTADPQPGPEDVAISRENIALAFIAALQLLPPLQRASLVLRDVLQFPAREAAAILGVTEGSLTSALKRARATVAATCSREIQTPAAAGISADEDRLVDKLTDALHRGDVEGIVRLLDDQAWLRMPPMTFEYQGPELIGRFLRAVGFRNDRRYRTLPARANGQPAFGVYLMRPDGVTADALGLWVIDVLRDKVTAITRFETGVQAAFGMPRVLHLPQSGP